VRPVVEVCRRGVRGQRRGSPRTIAVSHDDCNRDSPTHSHTPSDTHPNPTTPFHTPTLPKGEDLPVFGSLSAEKMRELAQSMQGEVRESHYSADIPRHDQHCPVESLGARRNSCGATEVSGKEDGRKGREERQELAAEGVEKEAMTEAVEEEIEEVEEEQVTEENMYEVLEKTIAPFAKFRYSHQLVLKERRAAAALKTLHSQLREVGAPPCPAPQLALPCPLLPIAPAPQRDGYRNADALAVGVGVGGRPAVGFLTGPPQRPATRCVPPHALPHLRRSHKEFARHLEAFLRQSASAPLGVWRGAAVRSSAAGLLACVRVAPSEGGQEAEAEIESDLVQYFTEGDGKEVGLTSLYIQTSSSPNSSPPNLPRSPAPAKLLHGPPYVEEECCGVRFRVTPHTLCPPNLPAFEQVLATIRDLAEIGPQTTVLNVFCGNGLLSIALGALARACVGVDSSEAAIEEARSNATLNGVRNCEFADGAPEKTLKLLYEEFGGLGDVVAVINAVGRKGLSPALLQRLRALPISRIVYLTSRPEGQAGKNFVALGNCLKTSKMRKHAPLLPYHAFTVDTTPHTEAFTMGVMFQRHHCIVRPSKKMKE